MSTRTPTTSVLSLLACLLLPPPAAAESRLRLHLGLGAGGIVSCMTDDFTAGVAGGPAIHLVWQLDPDLGLGLRVALYLADVPYGSTHGAARFGRTGYDPGLTNALTFVPTAALVVLRPLTSRLSLNLSIGFGWVGSSKLGVHSLKPRAPTVAVELDYALFDAGAGTFLLRLSNEFAFAIDRAFFEDRMVDTVLYFPQLGVAWRVNRL